jgi:predicted NBD/HSP70 family sugar kinase
MILEIKPAVKPELDPGFVPAVLWNRAFREAVAATGEGRRIVIALNRPNGTCSTFPTAIFPDEEQYKALNVKYVERIVKFMLWMKGGYRVVIAGAPDVATELAKIYSANGARAFDHEIMGERIYGHAFEVVSMALGNAPESKEIEVALGGHMDGCRIGFDLGGSDRKCAAVKDGEVVFTEEVRWDPYFEKDPEYHKAGIIDSIERAAAHLPRIDSIGGSSAGVLVDNQPRIASLFRGVSKEDFASKVVNIFTDIQKKFNVPTVVANDGEVTALAAAMSMNCNGVLGISLGTSLAAGYVNRSGNITDWLDELAFTPVDYRENGPVDEWSGDEGCGVQFFSQQGVARLAPLAGLNFAEDMKFPERLVEVQKLMEQGDQRAAAIYRTIGVCFGYAIAHYADFYDLRNLLILGRVTSGEGGEIILQVAEETLKTEFPELARQIIFRIPDEQFKRHGQAVIAASLPETK